LLLLISRQQVLRRQITPKKDSPAEQINE